MMEFWLAGAALLLDRTVGDPTWLPHPVVGMGRLIRVLDNILNRPEAGRAVKRVLGGVTVCCAIGITWVVSYAVLRGVAKLSPWAYAAASIALVWTTLAWKGLRGAGEDVYSALTESGLVEARKRVGRYVGRDTESLSEADVVRAAVETIAENTVDALVSPLFFACLGGAPLALVYRAINTMDSMLGYRNERYRDFGWAAARLDDVANYVPARLCAGLLWVAIRLAGLRSRDAWRVMRRDAHKHPSPNGGIPESLMAGALGVQLGGVNAYGGIAQSRALMGDPMRTLERQDIRAAMAVLDYLGWICFALVAAIGLL